MSSNSILFASAVTAMVALSMVQSAPQAAPSPATALAYSFAAETETLLKTPLKSDFQCEGKAYGYYADVDNNCQVFHIWYKFNFILFSPKV
jgi:hypothetical protein